MLVNNQAGQLLNIAQKVYPYAFALLNDEVAAYQLVADGLSRMTITEDEDSSFENLCRYCYELAGKSTIALSKGPKELFDHLSLEDKSILFLKEKEGMSVDQIAKIIGKTPINTHSGLTLARNNFFELLGNGS